MANEGEFPKIDGDIYYAKDANMSYFNGSLASTITYNNISVTTSPTQIIDVNISRKSILIRNFSDNIIYIGDSSVTTSNGYKLFPRECIYMKDTEAIYGIASSASDVRYLEVQ